MKTTKHALLALPAIALLVTGCGSSTDTRSGAEPDTRPVAAEPTSPATGSAVPTTIPDDLRLPHEGRWEVKGNGDDLSPMPGICVDPPQRLRDPAPTDGRAFYEYGTDASPSESLGVYADPAAATEAVADWREATATCGAAGPQSHTGEPVEWFVRTATVDGADEAWQAYELSEDVGGEDTSGRDPFVTVARVGNAVYVETFFRPGHLDDAAITASSETGAASVASYLPALAVFAS
ncbi:hypothetical protein [Nocardioides sp.]|uniref:hypothetical protein n=1 Tax=Nocardioides sp. TaxID=35761 RepID=UPI002725CBC9|nr:hypothetical protein [Nocardioides sp.]MDO9456195.1 hypothetical protein [Nocardioides sp.]